MNQAISVRLDEGALRALRMLQSGGLGRSEAVREALIEAAERRRSSDALRAEAERLASDPADRAVVAEIQAFMDDLDDDPW